MDTTTAAYKLLELIALSGELAADGPNRLGIAPSYAQKLITRLKQERLIKTHYKDKLRGYRLTCSGKKLLLRYNPERFSFYLTGSSDTNQPRSDLPRRYRLQQSSRVYLMLINAGVTILRDQKPLLFSPKASWPAALPLPVYYHSREIKELGIETVKINNSRMIGVLLSKDCIYAFYFTGDSLMKWEYRTEIRVKALLTHYKSRGLLSASYSPDTPIHAVLVGTQMCTGLKLMTSTGGYRKSYFYLDSSFDYFHFLPDTPAGDSVLKLLCNKNLSSGLRRLLLSDLQPPCPDYGFEHDAMDENRPVLLTCDFDMLQISRFLTALSLHQLRGNLICFDFQKETLAQYFGGSAVITTIDLKKFESRFFDETTIR